MTKKLEEEFNLPSMEEALEEEKVPTIEETKQEILMLAYEDILYDERKALLKIYKYLNLSIKSINLSSFFQRS